MFLEVLFGVPSSLFESVFAKLPFKQVNKHNLRAVIMLLPFLAADLEALFDLCLMLFLQPVEVVLMSLRVLLILRFSK